MKKKFECTKILKQSNKICEPAELAYGLKGISRKTVILMSFNNNDGK